MGPGTFSRVDIWPQTTVSDSHHMFDIMNKDSSRPDPEMFVRTMFYRLSLLLVGAFLTVSMAGCASSPSPTYTDQEPGNPYRADVLREGDRISILCEPVTNLNTEVKIPLNGMLDLQFVGQVKVAGKTAADLQSELLALYQKQTRVEVVTVKLIESSASVYVGGAVLRPGRIPMDRPMTVLEAIMEAGGYDPNKARLSKVTVVRVKDGRQTTFKVNVDRILSGKEPNVFYLQPFDTVQVPRRTINF